MGGGVYFILFGGERGKQSSVPSVLVEVAFHSQPPTPLNPRQGERTIHNPISHGFSHPPLVGSAPRNKYLELPTSLNLSLPQRKTRNEDAKKGKKKQKQNKRERWCSIRLLSIYMMIFFWKERGCNWKSFDDIQLFVEKSRVISINGASKHKQCLITWFDNISWHWNVKYNQMWHWWPRISWCVCVCVYWGGDQELNMCELYFYFLLVHFFFPTCYV